MTINKCKELTADMVKVMQAYIDGKKIMYRPQPTAFQDDTWCNIECPSWDWSEHEYAIDRNDEEEFMNSDGYVNFSLLKKKFHDNVKKHEEEVLEGENKLFRRIADSIEAQVINNVESGRWDWQDFRWVLGDSECAYFSGECEQSKKTFRLLLIF